MTDTPIPAQPFLHALLGPTASGKERLALQLAESLGAEIISVDSMKIYRGLDIGTAKPSLADRTRVRHHCLDVVEPTEVFNLARWVETAETAIQEIQNRNRHPLLSGGTALYYKGLLEGLFDGPAADPNLRAHLKRRAEGEGVDVLHAELVRLDPAAAAKVHAHDLRRVVRALEVAMLTGTPISEQQVQWRGKTRLATATSAFRYPCALVALDWPREILYQRIEARVERMMAAGLLEEAHTVFENRTRFSHTPLQAVAYKEFFSYFEGAATLAESVALLKKNTRNLAKSQMTWLRKFPCTWVQMTESRKTEDVAEEILAIWSK